VVGWREYVGLPDLGLTSPIRAKVDTGATTSALHAHRLTESGGFATFWVHPRQRNATGATKVNARVVDHRTVKSSNGHAERRPVIETHILIGDHAWPIRITLTRRDAMGYRMLLGRSALKEVALVDVAQSYPNEKPKFAGFEPSTATITTPGADSADTALESAEPRD